MIAASIATAAPVQAAPSGCSTDIEAGTRGSTVLARCTHGKGWYWVEASCLRPDGSGLRYKVQGEWHTPGSGYWSSYYPCKSPRNVIAATASID